MPRSKGTTYDELDRLGFQRAAILEGRDLQVVAELPSEPAVYVAVLDGVVFWVGETGNARRRFSDYRRWLALPDDSPRRDLATRDKLLEMAGAGQLIFFIKKPITIRSELTGKDYPAHRVEETILIDHFQPAWNRRPGGRSQG